MVPPAPLGIVGIAAWAAGVATSTVTPIAAAASRFLGVRLIPAAPPKGAPMTVANLMARCAGCGPNRRRAATANIAREREREFLSERPSSGRLKGTQHEHV